MGSMRLSVDDEEHANLMGAVQALIDAKKAPCELGPMWYIAGTVMVVTCSAAAAWLAISIARWAWEHPMF